MFYTITFTALVVVAFIIRLSIKRDELHNRLLQNLDNPVDNQKNINQNTHRTIEEDEMKIGDLVEHKLSGAGVIIGIEASAIYYDYKVMFADGTFFWVDSRLLEVISESR